MGIYSTDGVVRYPPIQRIVRMPLPFDETEVMPGQTFMIRSQPHLPFRLAQLWTFSPGPDFWVHDLRVGNLSMFCASGGVPAECWDIVAITLAVKVAMEAGWTPDLVGGAHPLYERLKIQSETCRVGTSVFIVVENRGSIPAKFKCVIQGYAIDVSGCVDFEDSEESKPYLPAINVSVPVPAVVGNRTGLVHIPGGKGLIAPIQPPVGVLTPIDALCGACGAMPGAGCSGVGKDKFHPTRGLKPGECPGCPRAAWAKGFQSKCNFCGKER